jgi:hypothetical protein
MMLLCSVDVGEEPVPGRQSCGLIIFGPLGVELHRFLQGALANFAADQLCASLLITVGS